MFLKINISETDFLYRFQRGWFSDTQSREYVCLLTASYSQSYGKKTVQSFYVL